MVVCSVNTTKYEHVVLTCFAHSQLFFFNYCRRSYIFTSGYITKTM